MLKSFNAKKRKQMKEITVPDPQGDKLTQLVLKKDLTPAERKQGKDLYLELKQKREE